MRYELPTDAELTEAASIAAAFSPRKPPRGRQSSVDVVVRNHFFAGADLRIRSGETLLLEADGLPLGETRLASGLKWSVDHVVDIDVISDTGQSYARGPVRLGRGTSSFELQLIPGYGPIVWADGSPSNVPGIGHTAQEKFAATIAGEYEAVWVIDDDLAPLGRGERYEIWQDGEQVQLNPFVHHDGRRVLHAARFSRGLHRLRIGHPRSRTILLDSEIVADGLLPWQVTLQSVGGDAAVRVERGDVTLIETSLDAGGWRQGYFEREPLAMKIDGTEIPHGLVDPEDRKLDKDRQFAEKMRDNYRKFVSERKRIRKKKEDEGESSLTPEEREIDAAKQKDMQALVDRWKRREGYRPQIVGKTNIAGETTIDLPPPLTAVDWYRQFITMMHEASHAAARQDDAESVGLEWEKVQSFFKALPKLDQDPNSLTADDIAILKWGADNREKLDKYVDLQLDPERAAEEEAREYDDEVRWIEAILRWAPRYPSKAGHP